MDEQLETFLALHIPQGEEFVDWGSEYRFLVKSYFSQELPPLKFVTSVRSLVIHKNQVLVIRDPERVHVMPGGRIESGEEFDETLERELLEETGWMVRIIHYVGFKHFHHLNPKPPQYPYPYPDFLQAIYLARASKFTPDAKQVDGYELEAFFHPLAEIHALPLTQSDHLYLRLALHMINA